MKHIFFFCFLIVLSLSFHHAKAQQTAYSKFYNFFEPEVHHHDWSYQIKGADNEAKFVFSVLFLIYKEIFSSQDVDSCVFTPSCSVYAVESVKKHGIIYGIMDAFDRLTRCNPAPKSFPIDPVTHKYYDPVQ